MSSKAQPAARGLEAVLLTAVWAAAGASLLGLDSIGVPGVFGRLAIAAAAVSLVPGYLVWILASPVPRRGRDHLELAVVSFGTGYGILLALCAAVLHLHGNAAGAAWFLWGTTGLLLVAAILFERGGFLFQRIPGELWFLMAGLLATAWVAYRMGAPIAGEEAGELVTARKLLENSALSVTNIMHRAQTPSTYLYPVYPFFVALAARVSALDLIPAYVQLRFLYVFLSLAGVYAAARILFKSRLVGCVALLSALVLIWIDPDPVTRPASLFPWIRRGSFAAGVLIPAFVVVYLRWLRDGRRIGLVAGLFLLAGLVFTHATEAVPVILLIGLAAAALVLFRRGEPEGWRAAWFALLAFVLLAGLKVWHGVWVGHIQAYAGTRNDLYGQVLSRLAAHPWELFWGPKPDYYREFFAATGRVLPITVLSFLMAPAVLFLSGGLAPVFLFAALGGSLILFRVPLFHYGVLIASSVENWFFSGYWTFFGWIVFALVLFLGARSLCAAGERVLRARSERSRGLALWIGVPLAAWGIARWIAVPLCWGALELVSREENFPALLTLIAAGIFGALWARRCRPRVQRADRFSFRRPGLVLVTTAVLSAALFGGLKRFPGALEGSRRETLWKQVMDSRKAPSVADWRAYYPVLSETLRPTSDLPLELLDYLRDHTEPESILLYDPDHIYAIPVFLNRYVAHSGFWLSSDRDYFDHVAREGGHPLFNTRPELEAAPQILEFLAAYRVDYLVANPAYRDRAAKIAERVNGQASLLSKRYDRNGYAVYRVDRAGLSRALALVSKAEKRL